MTRKEIITLNQERMRGQRPIDLAVRAHRSLGNLVFLISKMQRELVPQSELTAAIADVQVNLELTAHKLSIDIEEAVDEHWGAR